MRIGIHTGIEVGINLEITVYENGRYLNYVLRVFFISCTLTYTILFNL